ncbi:MAG TPA: hypothetical protein VNX40_16515 [Mucilaginibacter sp.]|jgi:hypothetical protein|nr:hypothetical protein [Mucilaginibacter sp.]
MKKAVINIFIYGYCMMNLLELFTLTKLNLARITIERDSGELLDYEFPITPRNFLNYSKQDIKIGDKRGKINALTNAKRAIDCQADKIFYSLGIVDSNFQKNKLSESINKYISVVDPSIIKRDLQYKFKLLEAMGFAPADIIARSRELRNKMEHFYLEPSLSDVRDAISLADLFINATESKLKSVWDYRISDVKNGGIKNGSCIDAGFDDEKKIINVYGFCNGLTYNFIVDQTTPEFYCLFKIAVSFFDNQDLSDAFKNLIEVIGHPIPLKNVKVIF